MPRACAERAQRRLGAVLGRGVRRQSARRFTTPTPIVRSMPRSARPRSTTSPWPRQMPIEPGATYVFDLGYYDYAWWAELDAAQCRIVTRFKSNTPLDRGRRTAGAAGRQHPLRPHRLPARTPGQEPATIRCRTPVREVRVETETGKVLRILSQRSRRQRPRDRRSLQAPMGHRTVLPLGQADPQDHPLPRHLRERRAHPDRRRPDRLPAAAPGSGRPERTSKARSPSPDWSAPTSCTADASTVCSSRANPPTQHPDQMALQWN